jgi:tRNA(fMet)-specific endonuclease VapC
MEAPRNLPNFAGLNGNFKVLSRLDRLAPEEVLLCAPVLAELDFGARCSVRKEENLQRVDRLIAGTRFVPFDLETARRFGQLKSALRRRGLMISDFDLTIAATALCQRSVLVSDDHAFHNRPIEGLTAENWLA